MEPKHKLNDFIAYLNDDGRKEERFCTVLDITATFVRFSLSDGTILTLPWDRVLKVKEKEAFQ